MWKLRNGRPKDGHVLHQRLKINKNWHIGFRFSQILVLTVFLLLLVFFFRRPFWIEVSNRKRWFAIPYRTMSWRTECVNLKKIAHKLKVWECPIEWHHNSRYYVNISKIWEKYHLEFLSRSCGPNFIEIGPIVFK